MRASLVMFGPIVYAGDFVRILIMNNTRLYMSYENT